MSLTYASDKTIIIIGIIILLVGSFYLFRYFMVRSLDNEINHYFKSKEKELLNIAKEKYPKGTLFFNKATGQAITSSGYFALSSLGNVYDAVNYDVVYKAETQEWCKVLAESK